MERGIIVEPIFSIIIPTYNLEHFIVDCLQSIEAQTINREKFELIVVDDCSSDDTCIKVNELLKNSSLKSQFRRHSTNKGPGIPRNTGIDLARGVFLLFVDGDDFLPANCLEELEQIVNEAPHDMDAIAYNWDFLKTSSSCDESPSDKGLVGQRRDKPSVGQRRDLDLALLPQIERVKLFLGMGMDGSVIYTAIRRSVFKENNIFFYPGLHEDIDVIYKIYWHCRVIKGTQLPLYYKRDREGSIVTTISKAHIEGYHRSWNEIGNFTKLKVSQDQWGACLSYFISGITGAVAIIILKIFNSFPEDKITRKKLYEYAYECYLKYYQYFVRDEDLPQKTYYDSVAGEFLSFYADKQMSFEDKEHMVSSAVNRLS
jgi:poly(ribitol-phosphate) beta-N-acetylglucosaminyltransferase